MTFDQFAAGVRGLLDGTAAGKNYNQNGADGENKLFDFVFDTTDDYGHALGEIIYKARRFAAKGNDEDLLKAAAWAFLVLQHKSRQQQADHRKLVTQLSTELNRQQAASTPTDFFVRVTN